MADQNGEDRRRGGTEADELGRCQAEESPVPAAPERLQDAPLNAVPDEVQEADVAGDEQAAARGETAPQEEQHENADQAQHRLIEEERDEVGIGRGASAKCRARVLRDPVLALDGDAPRQRRRRAVQLLVHEVAPAPNDLGDEDAGRDDVGPAPERDAVVADQPDHRDQAGEQAPVYAQPAVRRQEDLGQMVLVVGPLIDHVVGPPADQRGDRNHDQGVRDYVGPLTTFPRQIEGEPRGGNDRRDVANAIPADLEGTKG